MIPFDGSLKIGVLGGGQLGQMMIQEAIGYNFYFKVMDPDASAPCSIIANEFIQGDLKNHKDVLSFAQDCDVITIEIEKVNTQALKELQKQGKKVFPQPEVIEMIQDKGTQKEFYQHHHIPTAPFEICKNLAEVKSKNWAFPFVQKLRKDGYDGKGVHIIRSQADLEKGFDAPCLIERMVDFEKEISVIVARNSDGECKTFPAVEMEFHPEANLVEFQINPARISDFIALKAENIAIKIAEELNLVGLLAVELFLSADGELLVNELAPRPHNSGHQSIEGNITSQFEQHLRAILNLPLGNTDILKPAVMINLLGSEGYTGAAHYENINEAFAESGVYVHLYGKKETRPFRKMGHISIVKDSIEAAIETAQKLKQTLKVISK
jgi:5-(carboxyamino)imidazole ribonucleotide synthase